MQVAAQNAENGMPPSTLWWRHYEPGVRLLRVRKSKNGTCGFHITRSKWDPYPWVSDVDVGTPAYVCGLKSGDCILEVNGEDVLGLRITDVATLVRASAAAEADTDAAPAPADADADADTDVSADVRRSKAVTLLVWRNGAGSAANKCQPQSLCCGPMPRSLQRLSLVLQTILSLIECPVCMDTITPPTMQCQNGHLLCLPCRIRAEKCPVCRECYTPRRALTAEQIYNAIANGFQLGGNERQLRQLVFNNRTACNGVGIGATGGLATIQLPAAVQANVATTNTTNGKFKYLLQQQHQQQQQQQEQEHEMECAKNHYVDGDDVDGDGAATKAERDVMHLKRDLQALRQHAAGQQLSTSSWPRGCSSRMLPLPLSRMTAAMSAPSLLYVHQRRPCSAALATRRTATADNSSDGSSTSGVYSSDDESRDGDLSSSASTLPIDERLDPKERAEEQEEEEEEEAEDLLRFLCPCDCGARFADSTAVRAHVGIAHGLPILSFGMASAQLALPLRPPLDDCVLALHVAAAEDSANDMPTECWIRLRSQRKTKQVQNQQQRQWQEQPIDCSGDDALKCDKRTAKAATTSSALLMKMSGGHGAVETVSIEVSAVMLASATASADFMLATRLSANKVDKAFTDAPSPAPAPAPPATSTSTSTTSSSSSPSAAADVTTPMAAAAAAATKCSATDVSVMQLPSTNNNHNNNANGQQHQQQQQQHHQLNEVQVEDEDEDVGNGSALFETRSIAVHSLETTTWQATFEQHQLQQQQQQHEQQQQSISNNNNNTHNALLTRKNDVNVISVMQQASQPSTLTPTPTSISTPTPPSPATTITYPTQQQQSHSMYHNDVDLQLHIDVLHHLN